MRYTLIVNEKEKDLGEFVQKTEIIGKAKIDFTFHDASDVYSDGDEIEDFILDVFKKKMTIEDVLVNDARWPILYHLSPRRGNILLTMDISETDEVLEIGAGFGAITSPLSRIAKSVDAVELSKRRALANAYRNFEHENVTVIVGNFQNVKFSKGYDVILLIGVLEYAQLYIKSEKPHHDLLKQVGAILNPGGKVYIAIENRLGLKYFAGSDEDHHGIPFIGIEGYTQVGVNNNARTFSHSELDSLIQSAGFSSRFFYYPLPDYKFPQTIYSDDFLPVAGQTIPESFAFDSERSLLFDENAAMLSLVGTKEFKVFANSFLVEATLL